MMRAETFTRVERERERERATILINTKQAKRLALLNILKTGAKHKNV